MKKGSILQNSSLIQKIFTSHLRQVIDDENELNEEEREILLKFSEKRGIWNRKIDGIRKTLFFELKLIGKTRKISKKISEIIPKIKEQQKNPINIDFYSTLNSNQKIRDLILSEIREHISDTLT